MYQELNGKIVIPEKRLKWSQIPFQTVQEMKHTEKVSFCRNISIVYSNFDGLNERFSVIVGWKMQSN